MQIYDEDNKLWNVDELLEAHQKKIEEVRHGADPASFEDWESAFEDQNDRVDQLARTSFGWLPSYSHASKS
ncbi:Uncharacterised protein [Mycobacteroides abscessus subsp. bolletii]|uniref:hypothetical protein n=1 Tax=Mycobacteroides abscessus TaxID=36809 RepID=UPI0009A71A2E|nr:hypothetical protein [Mycobacteroides abscessus]QOF29126.1 hypothetical protein E3G43_002684 [Mycobacteroides abscessus]SLB58756.1 Uncharacterised protein [Mycobacteroides abscessus subsp. bolletii]